MNDENELNELNPPVLDGYTKIPTFKLWVANNFPYMETDFDAITNYDLMGSLTDYLNNVIQNEENVESNVARLNQAYLELFTYVKNYFDNLDVQEEINNKLDDLVADGTLTRLIGEYVQPLIDEQNQEISAFKTQVNGQIAGQNARIQAVESGSPLVATSVSEMTDTTRVYVNTTDGNWYYYNGTQWVAGGLYLADNTLNEKVKDLMLNKIYDNEVDMSDLNLVIGSVSITNGQFIDRTNRVRTTGFLYSYIFNLVKNTNNNYKIDALYYDATGTYLNSYSDWQNDYVVIPKNVPRFHLVITKIDNSDMTEDDIATIKASLKFYKPYDNLLQSEQNKLVNNIVISNNIQNAQKRQYNTERVDGTLSVDSFSSVSINKYNGNRGSTNDPYRVSTGRASYDTNGIRIVYNNPNYRLTVFYYTKSEGSQNGTWYQGFVEYGTQADFIPLYRNYSLQFERVDGGQIYGAEMLQEIVDSVKLYIATKNKIFSGYKRFEIENEVNGVTQKIKGILSLPSSYTEGGKPCKIIAMLHGGSGAITDSNWYGSDWNNLVTLLKNNGYAVFDINRLNENETNFGKTYGGRLAIENIHLAFKWIKEHYNVEDKMYIHGTSMGGATALSYILNYSNEVISCSCFAPVSNLSSIYLQEDQEMLAQCFGYSTQAEAIADGYKKIVGYAPALKFDRHDSTTNAFKSYNLETILPTIQNDYANRFWNKNDEFLRANLNTPIKIWIGSSDTVIDLPFCRKYVEALRNTGSNAELVELEGQDHHNISFALPSGMSDDWIEFLNRF